MTHLHGLTTQDEHQRQELEEISNLNRNIDVSGIEVDNVGMDLELDA